MQELNNLLEVITILAGVFLIERYVFLEPGMESRKQSGFYLLSFIGVIVIFLLFGKDAATYGSLAAGGLNIVFGRKKNRLLGFFLIIPIPGILNGLVVPIWVIAPNLLGFSEEAVRYYSLFMYGVLALTLLLFWVKGKAWRNRFQENMNKRHLHRWESILLYVSGILLLSFSGIMARQIAWNGQLRADGYDYAANGQFARDVGVFGLIAFVLTVAMIVLVMQGNKRAYYHEQVSAMQFNMIAMMADLVESRDGNTGGHIKRTAKFVEIIADTLKKKNRFSDILTTEYLSDMVVAAPLHDIGKIHIPDAILNKPGRLTDEEFAVMKSHAAAGRDLLRQAEDQMGRSAYLDMAVEMAAYHHEWWNGEGYPDGIKEEEIPLCARIMAVADVFDALTSKRCYKDAMPLKKAYAIIREETGTHFDPTVAEAFFAAVPEIEEALREF
ncbi:MAG: HD domain-containing protein [Bacteroidales bacterium]|nr:HD domain-containing protein [Bacteroidales bacterium]MCM1416453.1 HD domain-containing protein [bacterium]MCM1424428.1 HD domain-containing protein [bacterium]